MECLICFEELNQENTLEYQTSADGTWETAQFCNICTEYLRINARKTWENQVRNSTCAKEQRNLLTKGPPTRVRDINGFPKCKDGEVYQLRNAHTKKLIPCECIGEIDPEIYEFNLKE